MAIQERYLNLLAEHNVKTAEVSRQTGIPYSTLNEWANGKTKKISGENLNKIAEYFNVPIDYFYTVVKDESNLENVLKKKLGVDTDYYVDPEVAQMAQALHDDPDMRGLFKAARGLSKEDIVKFKEIIEGYERGK